MTHEQFETANRFDEAKTRVTQIQGVLCMVCDDLEDWAHSIPEGAVNPYRKNVDILNLLLVLLGEVTNEMDTGVKELFAAARRRNKTT